MAEAAGQPARDVVSSEEEMLILVDEDDRVVGHLSKGACHDGQGALHRAFSLFIFNRDGELLIQRRSPEKRLWPLYWSNSCCSHPREGETMDEAVDRRLREELGLSSDLLFLFKFQYQARYEDVGSENEMCWVYLGVANGPATPNRHEVEDLSWVTAAELDERIDRAPEEFTPWIRLEWPRVRNAFRSTLGL